MIDEYPFDLEHRPPRRFRCEISEEPSRPTADLIASTLRGIRWERAARLVVSWELRCRQAEHRFRAREDELLAAVQALRGRLQAYEPAIAEHCPKAPAESSD